MNTLQERLAEVLPSPPPRGMQAQIAKLCGVSGASVSAWFNNPKKVETISRAHAAIICTKFGLQVSPDWLAEGTLPKMAPPMLGQGAMGGAVFEAAGSLRPPRPVVVVGQAKLGDNGYYEEISSATGAGDGTVGAYSSDPEAYALRVKGDSMFPAIRDGWYVVVEPNGNLVIGEFILVKLLTGQKMVKELLMQNEHGITVMSVNGSTRRTIGREEIDNHHGLQPVSSILPPSKWKPV